MATDKFPDVKELTIKNPEKGVISFVANGVIAMWAPVIVVAPPTATRLPRVSTVAVTNSPLVIGVAAGGSGDVAAGNAADAAGDIVDVAVIGGGAIVKCKVDGAVGGNIVIGELLITDATAGQAEPADTIVVNNEKFALGKALFPSTVNGDTIPIIMMGGGA